MSDEDHELADRGRSLMLGVLIVVCLISACTVVLQLVVGSKLLAPMVRFALNVLLAYFVYKGSLAARIIFSILCVLGSLFSLYGASALLIADLQSRPAVTFLMWGGFYLLAAWAPWSKPVMAYWNSIRPNATGRDN